MPRRTNTAKRTAPPRSTGPSEENMARHRQYMDEAEAKGLLYPREEWPERIERGLKALFGPAPAKRTK